MRPSGKYHPVKFSLLGLLIGGSSLGSVWYVVKSKQREVEKIEIVRQDSIQASKQSNEVVEDLFENMLVVESRSKILDTILNKGALSQSTRQQILEELKDQNTILTALRCDLTKEDSVQIENISGSEQSMETEEPIENMPPSEVAKKFSARWVRKGKIKSHKQIEISFEYLKPHHSDTLPVFVLVKDSSGILVDHIKKCLFSQTETFGDGIENQFQKKKISFKAQLAETELKSKPEMVYVYHSRDGFIGCSKLK